MSPNLETYNAVCLILLQTLNLSNFPWIHLKLPYLNLAIDKNKIILVIGKINYIVFKTLLYILLAQEIKPASELPTLTHRIDNVRLKSLNERLEK